MPDSVFIEDTAVVLPEIAVIARPGAESRRLEVNAVAAGARAAAPPVPHRAPGTLDGGDVLVIGRTIFVGRSTRTNDAGVEQLRAAVAPFGYAVEPMSTYRLPAPEVGCHRHRRTNRPDQSPVGVATAVPGCARRSTSTRVSPARPTSSALAERIIAAASFPRTCARLEEHGIRVTRVDASELAKAEGALTCCSLLVS